MGKLCPTCRWYVGEFCPTSGMKISRMINSSCACYRSKEAYEKARQERQEENAETKKWYSYLPPQKKG